MRVLSATLRTAVCRCAASSSGRSFYSTTQLLSKFAAPSSPRLTNAFRPPKSLSSSLNSTAGPSDAVDMDIEMFGGVEDGEVSFAEPSRNTDSDIQTMLAEAVHMQPTSPLPQSEMLDVEEAVPVDGLADDESEAEPQLRDLAGSSEPHTETDEADDGHDELLEELEGDLDRRKLKHNSPSAGEQDKRPVDVAAAETEAIGITMTSKKIRQ